MEGRFQGQLDSPLTEYGVEQVTHVAHMLRVIVNDISDVEVFSSPLGRTLQTTKIICNTLGYDLSKVKIDSRLTEVSIGSWDGLTISEIEDKFPGALVSTDQYDWYFNNPDGETYEAVVARVSSWLDSIEDYERVIAISHGLTGRILRGVYAKLEKRKSLELEVSQNIIFKLSNGTIERIQSSFDYDL